LIPQNNVTKLVKQAILVLNDQTRLQELSTNAYQSSEQFNAETIWQQWQIVNSKG